MLFPVVFNQYSIWRSNADVFRFPTCSQDCNIYTAYQESFSKCFLKCQCDYGKTFFQKESGEKKCVSSPGHIVGCKFHFKNSHMLGMALHQVKLQDKSTVYQIGEIVIPGQVKSLCNIISDSCKYWNIDKWDDLFTEGRKSKHFYIEEKKKRQAVRFTINPGEQKIYEGLLIRLEVYCPQVSQSCLMFKFEGYHHYGIESKNLTVTTTQVASTTPVLNPTPPVLNPTPVKSSKDNGNITIIIVISIVVVVVFILIGVILLCVCIKRRRNNKSNDKVGFKRDKLQQSKVRLLKQKDDEDHYHSPSDVIPGTVCEIDDIENPGYLKPVDCKPKGSSGDAVYLDPDSIIVIAPNKKKDDPTYDYPELKKLKKKHKPNYTTAVVGGPVYAEMDEKKIVHQYTDLDDALQKHKQKKDGSGYAALNPSDVSDAGGYQPLNTSSQDLKEQPQADKSSTDALSKSPKYFEIEPERSDATTPDCFNFKADGSRTKEDVPLPPSPKYFEIEPEVPLSIDNGEEDIPI